MVHNNNHRILFKCISKNDIMRPDIKPEEYTYHNWVETSAEESLLDIYRICETHAENVINWYLTAKKNKKICAQILRFGIILFTALAGIIPILSQLKIEQFSIQPGWSAVALGVAGLFLGFDHYFGCSTAWMRFMVTEHKIRQHLHKFRFENEIAIADWTQSVLDSERIKDNLFRCRNFLSQVDQYIRDETDQWVIEFQKTIKQIDDNTIKQNNSH